MSTTEPRDDGPRLSPALERVRRAAEAANRLRRPRGTPPHPLGPRWLWALGLLGSGSLAAMLLLLLALGPPWVCRQSAAMGSMVTCTIPTFFVLLISGLGLEELRERVLELLRYRERTERVAGVVTRAALVERQLDRGGYSRHAEVHYKYEVRGRMRKGEDQVSFPSVWGMKRLVRRHAPGAVVAVRLRPGEPDQPRILGPGRLTVAWLAARALLAVVAGGLMSCLLYAGVASIVGAP